MKWRKEQPREITWKMGAVPLNIDVPMSLPIRLLEICLVAHSMTSSNLIGAAIPRAEDNRLLRGAGCYSDDQTRDEVAYAIMVRSDVAHALLVGLNCEAAKTSPGVLAVLTGEDWRGDGLHPMPFRSMWMNRQLVLVHPNLHAFSLGIIIFPVPREACQRAEPTHATEVFWVLRPRGVAPHVM